MRRALPHLCALACGVAAALVVGCGDRSHLIPPQSASSLKDGLAQVREAVDAGDCTRAQDALEQSRAQAQALPASVDRRLRHRINEGIQNLEDTVPRDCAANRTESTTTETQTQTVQTQTTETTTTDTTPTVTEPPPTTTEPPATTTEPPPTPTEPPPSTEPNGGTPEEPQP